jgi:hypothetical protein
VSALARCQPEPKAQAINQTLDAARLGALVGWEFDGFDEAPAWDDLYERGFVRSASDLTGETWPTITREGEAHLTSLLSAGAQAEPQGEARDHIARMRESAVRVGELNDEIHGAVPSEGQGPTEANYIAACEYAARKLFDEGVLGDVSIPTAARLMAPVVQEVLAAVAGGRGEGRDG